MRNRHMPKAARRRLLFLLVAGGVIGALAAMVHNRAVQLCLVGVAVGVGLYAGLMMRQALQGNNPCLDDDADADRAGT